MTMTTDFRSKRVRTRRAIPSLLAVIVLSSGMALSENIQALDVANRAFPELIQVMDVTEKTGAGISPCKRVHKRSVKQLDLHWRASITNIRVNCKVSKGIEGEPDPSTNTTATLKPKTIHFSGVPVIEIRRFASAWGSDDQYILDARFADVRKRLVAVIEANCRRSRNIVAGGEDSRCRPENDPGHHGIYFDTGEGGGIWLHPDEKNTLHTIYAVAWSE